MAASYMDVSVQGTASVTTYATLYDTTASGVSAVVSRILVCNTAGTAATFRIAVMTTAGTPAAADWRYYDVTVLGNDTLELPGLALQNGRYVRVSSSANTVTFAIELSELTP